MHAASPNYRFHAATALVFLASAVATIAWCGSMSGMGGMSMPGGWTMSMAWMRMPGQGWLGATASFLGMWAVMMVAMMLPAVTGYFFVWLLVGVLLYPAGIALAQMTMKHPGLSQAIPPAAGVLILAAGAVQLSAWKSRQLSCCRGSPALRESPPVAVVGDAWRHGMRLGVRCSCCCAPLMAASFVFGIMDLRVMAAVTAAVCVERLLPRGELLARFSGLAITATGVGMIAGLV